MSKFIKAVGKYEIVRQHEYTQFDTGYAVLDENCKRVAFFEDNHDDSEGKDSALVSAIAWCEVTK